MASLKSATVGRFVALRATVVRCSAIHPLVLRAEFECSKCGEFSVAAVSRSPASGGACHAEVSHLLFPVASGARIMQPFPDGTFTMPEACTTPRCRNRAFELRRDTAETVDFQKIKVREKHAPGRSAICWLTHSLSAT